MNRSTWSPQFIGKWLLLTTLIAIPISLLMYWSVAQFEPWWTTAFTPDTITSNPVWQSELEFQRIAARQLQIATASVALLVALATAYRLLSSGLRSELSIETIAPLAWTLVWVGYGIYQARGRSNLMIPLACILPISLTFLAVYNFAKGKSAWRFAMHGYIAIIFLGVMVMQLFWLNLDDFLINAALD